MHFTIAKTHFTAALARCAVICDVKASMAILANCLLTVTPDSLKIFATDLEVGYETAIEIRDYDDLSSDPFIICVGAKKLCEFAKAIPASDILVTIDAASHTITLGGGTAAFSMAGLDAEEYPSPQAVTGTEITIPAQQLHDALAPVTYCQSKDKPNLSGVWLKLEENVDDDLFLVTAATDGHRICLNSTPLSGDEESVPLDFVAQLHAGVIIPSKAVTEILHLDTAGPAVVTVSSNHLVVSSGTERLTLRLIEGTFPDIDRVIPTEHNSRIIIKRQAFIDGVSRVRIASDKENMRGVTMETTLELDGITLAAAIPQQGIEAHDRVTADIIATPPPMRLCSEYLLQALNNIGTASVELLFKDAMSGLLITPVGTDFPQAVIMPMRGA